MKGLALAALLLAGCADPEPAPIAPACPVATATFQPAIIRGERDVSALAANACTNLTMSVSPLAIVTGGEWMESGAVVSAGATVEVRLFVCNPTDAPIDPPKSDYRAVLVYE